MSENKKIIYIGPNMFITGLNTGDVLEYVKPCGEGCIAKDKLGKIQVLMGGEFVLAEELIK